MPPTRRAFLAFLALLAAACQPAPARPAAFITIASTTSAEQSGLFGRMMPLFTWATEIEVRVSSRARWLVGVPETLPW